MATPPFFLIESGVGVEEAKRRGVNSAYRWYCQVSVKKIMSAKCFVNKFLHFFNFSGESPFIFCRHSLIFIIQS